MGGKFMFEDRILSIKVKELAEGIEQRQFLATVVNVTCVSQKFIRVKLSDSEGDCVYCLLFDKWACKNISIKKGNKVNLGPSLIKVAPEKLVKFYCPHDENVNTLLYFHYEDDFLGFELIEDFEPLSQADLLRHIGNSVNIQGSIVDLYKVQHDKTYLIEIKLIDSSIQEPINIRLYRSHLNAAIGDVLKIYSVTFVNFFNETYGLAALDSEIEVVRQKNEENLNCSILPLFENFEKITEKIGFLTFEAQPFFCCVLEEFCNFPEVGKFLYIVYDHKNFYFLVSFVQVCVGWVKITRCKVVHGYVEIDELSSICGFPEWLEPVKQIITNYSNQLQIVLQEAKRSTSFFHSISINN